MPLRRRVRVCALALLLVAGPAAAQAPQKELVSVSTYEVQGDGNSGWPQISADGRYVTFWSDAKTLGGNLVPSSDGETYLRDRVLETTEHISAVGADRGVLGIARDAAPVSPDGRYIAFRTFGKLTSQWAWGAWLNDRQAGSIKLVSIQGLPDTADGQCLRSTMSFYGTHGAFISWNSTIVMGDDNNVPDVFVYSIPGMSYERIPMVPERELSGYWSDYCRLSANGRYLAFNTRSKLVQTDTDNCFDVYLYDRETGFLDVVSVRSEGKPILEDACGGQISDDGRYILFQTGTLNPGYPGVAFGTAFAGRWLMHDRLTLETVLVHAPRGCDGLGHAAAMTPDGRYVAYESKPRKPNTDECLPCEAFVRDMRTGEVGLIAGGGCSGEVLKQGISISADGRYVALASSNPCEVENDKNGRDDVIVSPVSLAFRDEPPAIELLSPSQNATETWGRQVIRWRDSDNDDDARVSLFYYGSGVSGQVPIATDLSEDDDTDCYNWETSELEPGTYWVYAAIQDDDNPAVQVVSGPVYVLARPFALDLAQSDGTPLTPDTELVVGDADPADDAVRLNATGPCVGGNDLWVQDEVAPGPGESQPHVGFAAHYPIPRATMDLHISIPAIPVLNSPEHTLVLRLLNTARQIVWEKRVPYRVAAATPDTVVVTNVNRLRELFGPQDFQESVPGRPSIPDLLHGLARDGAVFLYTQETDPARVQYIRQAMDDGLTAQNLAQGIRNVFVLGPHSVVPMGKVSGSGIPFGLGGFGDYPYWSDTGSGDAPRYAYARLPLNSMAASAFAESAVAGDAFQASARLGAQRANYDLARRLLENVQELRLHQSGQLYLSGDDVNPDAPHYNSYTVAEALRQALAGMAGETRHHTDNAAHRDASEPFDAAFLADAGLLWAVGDAAAQNLGEPLAGRALLDSWAYVDETLSGGFALRMHAGGPAFTPADYLTVGPFPGPALVLSQEDGGPTLTAPVQSLPGRPLAFIEGSWTGYTGLPACLGSALMQAGAFGYGGFAAFTNRATARSLGQAYADSLATLGASQWLSLGQMHAAALAAASRTLGLPPRLEAASRRALVQLGVPTARLTAAPADPLDPGEWPPASLAGAPLPAGPVAVTVTGHEVLPQGDRSLVSLQCAVDGVGVEPGTWALPGNPVLPVLRLRYALDPAQAVQAVTATGQPQSLGTLPLYEAPAQAWNQTLESYPLAEPVLFDPPLRWRVERGLEGQRTLVVELFPLQYHKATQEALLYDALSVAIDTVPRTGRILDAVFDEPLHAVGATACLTVATDGGDLVMLDVDGVEADWDYASGATTFTIPTAGMLAGNHDVLCRLYDGEILLDSASLSFDLAQVLVQFTSVTVPEQAPKDSTLPVAFSLVNFGSEPAPTQFALRIWNDTLLREYPLYTATVPASGRSFEATAGTWGLKTGPAHLAVVAFTDGGVYQSAPMQIWLLGQPADVDGDNMRTAVDVQLVINAVLGRAATPTADVNADGRFDATDVQMVINAVLGRT